MELSQPSLMLHHNLCFLLHHHDLPVLLFLLQQQPLVAFLLQQHMVVFLLVFSPQEEDATEKEEEPHDAGAVPGRGLEGAKPVQGWKPGRHYVTISFTNLIANLSSFVEVPAIQQT